ncbi:MAG: YchJ family protein [Cellvibrionaceae bacterium]
MDKNLPTHCICQSQKPFKKCCDRFLNAGQYPKTPEQLMRSRYSAYALGGYGEYLLATWLPAMAKNLSEQQLSHKESEWAGLEILSKSQKGDDGEVEFKAYYRDLDGGETDGSEVDSSETDGNGNKALASVLHEKSVFKRIQGRWLYVGGEVSHSELS